jgi:hypothetical protein
MRSLGAQYSVKLSDNHCPTCHQPVYDTLLMENISGPQMDLESNIAYLGSQCRMLERQVAGFQDAIRKSERSLSTLASRVAAKHDELSALRGDVSTGATQSRAIVRRQVIIETIVEKLEHLSEESSKYLSALESQVARFARNLVETNALPKDYYSRQDEARILLFQKLFRANAGTFGYESAPIRDIEINLGTLLPFLSQLELREIIARRTSQGDIRSDSSASDFVRLIWSYLVALYQISNHESVNGNHPGILFFDEPGQHSMAEDSQHALLQMLSAEDNLQSIVAASFDESESVFLSATRDVKFQLIQWEGRLLRPLEQAAIQAQKFDD